MFVDATCVVWTSAAHIITQQACAVFSSVSSVMPAVYLVILMCVSSGLSGLSWKNTRRRTFLPPRMRGPGPQDGEGNKIELDKRSFSPRRGSPKDEPVELVQAGGHPSHYGHLNGGSKCAGIRRMFPHYFLPRLISSLWHRPFFYFSNNKYHWGKYTWFFCMIWRI